MSEGSVQVWSAGRRKAGTAAVDRALQRETAPLRVQAPRPYRRQVITPLPCRDPQAGRDPQAAPDPFPGGSTSQPGAPAARHLAP